MQATGEKLFKGLIQERRSGIPKIQKRFYWYLGIGIGLIFINRAIFEMPHFQYTLILAPMCVAALLSVVLIGLARRHRKQWGVQTSDWISILTWSLLTGVALYGYLPLVNALRFPDTRIVYAGPVQALWKCEREPGHSSGAGGNVARAALVLTAPYCVEILDTASQQDVSLEIGRRDFLRLSVGQPFSQWLHLGLLGVPYRWAWES